MTVETVTSSPARQSAAAPTAWSLSRFWVWLGSITLLGAVIRLITLGAQPFWLDEGVSYVTAARPLPALLAFVGREDIHPPLYYVLLHGWLAGGDSEAWLRLLSALFGIASVTLMGLVGRQVLDERAGLIAAFVFAISPVHVWYAQEARMYALVIFLALAMILCLWQVITGAPRQVWWWVGVTAAGVLLLYTSTSSIWLLAALNLFMLGYVLATRRWPLLGRWAASQAVTALLFLPWLPSLRHQLAISREMAAWIATPTIGTVTNLLADFNSRNLPFWFRASLQPAAGDPATTSPWQAFGTVNVLFIALMLAAALVLTVRQRRPAQWLLWCLLLTPIGLAFLISQRYVALPLLSLVFSDGQSVFTVKNLLIASLPYYLFIGMVLARAHRGVQIGTLVALVGLNLISFQLETELRGKEDWRGVAATLRPLVRPDDLVVFSPGYLESPYAYYQRHGEEFPATRGYPIDDVGVHEPARTSSVAQIMNGAPRIWLIEAPAHKPQASALGEALAATGQPAWQQAWQGVTVRRYDR